jgi:hypothetical protein
MMCHIGPGCSGNRSCATILFATCRTFDRGTADPRRFDEAATALGEHHDDSARVWRKQASSTHMRRSRRLLLSHLQRPRDKGESECLALPPGRRLVSGIVLCRPNRSAGELARLRALGLSVALRALRPHDGARGVKSRSASRRRRLPPAGSQDRRIDQVDQAGPLTTRYLLGHES